MTRSQQGNWKNYCSEPLDKIEHYEEALAEGFKGWCIHHMLEIQPDGTRVSAKELIDQGLYFGRPASELIFMRFGEHSALHNKGENNPLFGKCHSEETCQKMSKSRKGKHHSAETRHKMSESLSGENNPLFGKHRSAETRQKISVNNGRFWKGKHWWNNGISSIRSRECPGEGWTRGRLRFK